MRSPVERFGPIASKWRSRFSSPFASFAQSKAALLHGRCQVSRSRQGSTFLLLPALASKNYSDMRQKCNRRIKKLALQNSKVAKLDRRSGRGDPLVPLQYKNRYHNLQPSAASRRPVTTTTAIHPKGPNGGACLRLIQGGVILSVYVGE